MDIIRLNSHCISCLLNKHLYDFPKEYSSAQKVEYMQGILKIIGNAGAYISAPEIVESINSFKKSLGINTDYSKVKSYFNNYMLSLEKDIERKICSSETPLKSAVKYAMTGNFIDFGAMDSVDEQKLKLLLENANDISIDDNVFETFENEIIGAKNIVYLTDNCGEIVLDKLLIKQVLKLNKTLNIDVIVRGEPVLNDCTIEDAKEVELDRIVSVVGNGTAIAGTVINKVSPQAKNKLDNADLIISKGQGNFETMRYCGKNVYYMFLCKCKLFAERFGVDTYTGIFINEINI